MFESPDEARRATQKDRETFGDKFGDRYVRVYPTLESDVPDMQQAVVQQSMTHQQVSTDRQHIITQFEFIQEGSLSRESLYAGSRPWSWSFRQCCEN